ncbi:hypothetical protein BKA69DRAFT_1127524 [Paraphysoderma sedebokerense]|nr:hypothetical protein BKA69DRAFT_1127524 [Paraphysoderma sedebokerense]
MSYKLQSLLAIVLCVSASLFGVSEGAHKTFNQSISSLEESICFTQHLTTSNKLVKREFTDSCAHRFVGYHGSCENHKTSLESRIQIKRPNFTPQLGPRFYVADEAKLAIYFAKRVCDFPKKPILCAIYMKSPEYSQSDQIYIPENSDDGSPLWADEAAMKNYEKHLLGNSVSSTIRLSEIFYNGTPPRDFFSAITSGIQAAFDSKAVADMKAKCITLNDPGMDEDARALLHTYKTTGYKRSLLNREVAGSTYYDPNRRKVKSDS